MRMTSFMHLVMVGAAAFGYPPRITAQERPRSLLEERIAQLKSDSYLRIANPLSQRVAGSLTGREPGTLTLQTDAGSRTFQLAEIQTLWVRGRATKTGAIVGAILGVVGGALFGAWVENTFCDCPDPDAAGAALRGGLIFGAGGAVLGAVVGTAIPKWHRRYP